MSDLACIVPIFNFANDPIIERNHRLAITLLKEDGVDIFSARAYLPGHISYCDDYATESPDVIWQKESLVNYVANKIRSDYDYIAWIDSGIFLTPGWAKLAIEALSNSNAVQCFNRGIWLNEDETEASRREGYVARFLRGEDCNSRPKPSVGGAWAVRSSLFDQMDLYDRSIVGGGDTWAICAFLETYTTEALVSKNLSTKHRDDIDEWLKKAHSLHLGCGYIDATYYHLWHTTPEKRQHKSRHQILVRNKYNPRVHVESVDGILRWTNKAPKSLARQVESFILARASQPRALCQA